MSVGEAKVNSLLAKIVAEKYKEVERLKKTWHSRPRSHEMLPLRDFKGTISMPGKVSLIAEIKFASPSAGIICERMDPVRIGKAYEKAGAKAVSLLTDKEFFGGDLRYLPPLKKAVSLPVLRKDFIVDEIQVRESFLWGADAILLIARILSRQQLAKLLGTCKGLGMAGIVEVHNQNDLNKAIACGAEIIGINNRDLETFEVNFRTTMELAPRVPEGHIIVSESGIKNGSDIRFLMRAGINAVLVGTSIMKSRDPLDKTRELVLSGKDTHGKSQDLRYNECS